MTGGNSIPFELLDEIEREQEKITPEQIKRYKKIISDIKNSKRVEAKKSSPETACYHPSSVSKKGQGVGEANAINRARQDNSISEAKDPHNI